MAKITFSELALTDLEGMDGAIIDRFYKYFDKIRENPQRRHLKHGIPIFVEDIGQGRIAYKIEEGVVYIVRCFSDHKEYEKWFKTFK